MWISFPSVVRGKFQNNCSKDLMSHSPKLTWNELDMDKTENNFLVLIKTYQFVHTWRLSGGLQEYILVQQLQRLQKSSCRWCTLHNLKNVFLWIALALKYFIKSKLWSLYGKCVYQESLWANILLHGFGEPECHVEKSHEVELMRFCNSKIAHLHVCARRCAVLVGQLLWQC